MRKNILKKAISIILTFALVLGVASVSGFAATASPLFEISDAKTRQGEEFEITVKFARSITPEVDPIAALDVSLSFNSEIYSVVSMENGEGLNKALEAITSEDSKLEKDYIFSTSANVEGEVKWSLITLQSFTFTEGEEFMKIRFKANDLSDLSKDLNMTIKVTNAAAPETLENVTNKFAPYTNKMEVEVNLTTMCDWEYVESLGGYRLVKFNGANAETFTIPLRYDDPDDSRGSLPVVSIGSGAFRGCTTIKKISLSKNVAEVGSAAFMECENLEKIIVFSDETKFGANALWGTSENNFVVKCIEGSVADTYAQNNGFKVEYFESIRDCTLSGTDEKVYYTGSPVFLSNLKVYNSKGEALKLGADYTVYYANNVKIGTAMVLISGRGEYLEGTIIQFNVLCPYHTEDSAYYTEETVYADCEKDGYVIKDCTFCDYHDESTVAPAKAHGELIDVVDTDSTCSEAGVMNHVCKDCAKVISTSEIPTKEHTNPEEEIWIEINKATCGVAGLEALYCANCDHIVKEREIPALEHSYSHGVIKEPTCQETGLEGMLCANCGDYYDETEMPVVDHDIKWIVTTEPTCTEKGEETYQCRFCGYYEGEKQTQEVEAQGCEGSEWVVIKDATCDELGEKVQYCIRCGEVCATESIPVLGHSESEWITTSELTCTTDGCKVKYCTACGEELDVSTEKAPGHTSGEWKTVTKLTCTQDGYKEHYCSVCDKVYETESEEAQGHTSGKWVTVKATCAKEGAQEHHCLTCDEVYESKPIQKLPHTESDWIVVATPDCTKEGMRHKICTVCEEALETEVIPAAGHFYVRTTEKLPTYKSEGKDNIECGECGEFIRSIPVRKLSADIDGKGSVTSADALLILQHATGLKELTEDQVKNANLDGYGGVNSADALIVLQISTGLIVV
ncbi:MAG: leucine-rich repeat protein [Clostridia bacterium]|nr:leucine-rich repeat protein [Clostridia bacterium]